MSRILLTAWVALAIAGTAPAQVTLARQAGAQLAGRVVDPSNAPVRRAIVQIIGEAGERRSIVTGDDGRFEIRALPAGRFSIAASKPGFVTSYHGARAPGRPGTAVRVVEGQSLTNLVVRIAKGAVITGTVRDTQGEAAGNVSIALIRVRGGNQPVAATGPPLLLPMTTDDRGIYRLHSLDPGTYLVAAAMRPSFGVPISGPMTALPERDIDAALQQLGLRTRPGGPPPALRSSPTADADQYTHSFAPIFAPSTPSAAEATAITVAAGEERTGVDIVVRPVRSLTIEGTITNPGGPLPTVQLSIEGERPVSLPGLFGTVISGTRVDAEGRFKFTGVSPGRYSVAVWTRSAMPAGRGGAGGAVVGPAAAPDPAAPSEPFLWASAEVVVSDQDVRGVALALAPGFVIRGRVEFAGSTGAQPPKDVTTVGLALVRSGGSTSSVINGTAFGRIPVPPARMQTDGTFEFSRVAPGEYLIAPRPLDGWYVSSATIGGRDFLDTPIAVSGSVDGVRVVYTDRRTEIAGTLQTPSGAPASDYFIVVFPTDSAMWRAQSRRLAYARPASDGAFAIRNLPAGDYYIAALTDLDLDEWRSGAFLDELVPASIKLSLAEGGTVRQDLRLGR